MNGSSAASKDGRVRVVIEAVRPAVDGGAFAVKRVVGDEVCVEADCFADGHDQLACLLLFRREDDTAWRSSPMRALGNDRWRGAFSVDSLGSYRYTVTAWVDHFLSWRHDFERRVDAEDLRVAAIVGASLLDAAARRAQGPDRQRLADWARRLRAEHDPAALRAIVLDQALGALAQRFPDRSLAATHPVELRVIVDRPLARCSAWYELFPRSCSATPGAHGTFADCAARLPYIAAMGFDGGKMLFRIDPDDPATVVTMEACARAVSDLASHGLMAMVEPFISHRVDGRVRNDLSPEAVIRSITVAAGLGTTSAYTWLKLPVVEDMERVLAASTLPVLLLGGEVSADQDAAFESWRKTLQIPSVHGLVIGRSLLFPPDDDVAGAVDTVVTMVRG